MDYNSLVRKARSKNIRITKKTAGGRRYLTAAELSRKLKRKKTKKVVKKIGFFARLFGGSRRVRKVRKARKLRRKVRKLKRKRCVCNSRRCKCRNRKLLKRRYNPVKSGALFALKTLATGAAIQLGSEAAKKVIQMY
jgi:hypothetical protein